MKKILLISIAISSLIFSGCAGTVRSNVVRFHQLPPTGSHKSFVVVPTQQQKGSIEFSIYANRIAQKLTSYGWRAGDYNNPDYAVFVSYGIGEGQTVSGSMPIYGQTGGGTSYSSGTVRSSYGGSATYTGTTYTQPTFGQTGSIPYSQTLYSRTLLVSILDAKSIQNDSPTKVFEGRVTSRGSSSDISTVMPNMIEALFKKFPGISGKSEIIEMSLIE